MIFLYFTGNILFYSITYITLPFMEKKIEPVIVGSIETNCWLYPLDDLPGREQRCVVIDPGDEAALIIARLHELHWIPEFIFLTHGHFDHVAALPDLLEAYGGHPQIGIHPLDAHYLGKDALAFHRDSFAAAGGNPVYVDSLWKPLPEANILFEEGDMAGPFKVLHLPGHTPGSIGFYDEKAGVLFSGDTLFRGAYGRTDLPGGNPAHLRQSLKRLFSMNKEIHVCPGHGPGTTIGEEEQTLGLLL